MGKGTDKLYITHSEWASTEGFSASSGHRSKTHLPFRRLPFRFCALSLQPFENPVCTPNGTIFELTHILPWLLKHGTNPVDGTPLQRSSLITLHIPRNDAGELCDPVTFKAFTDNTHVVAIATSGNVFAWDTVDRLNIKAKQWRDLVSDTEFSRKDIITLQDPHALGSRDMSSFKYIQDGESTLTPEQEAERADPLAGINTAATGSAAKILAAKAAVAKARAEKAAAVAKAAASKPKGGATELRKVNQANKDRAALPYNAAQHTTGRAAASLTSTALTPHVGNERALLSEEEFMLHPRRVKIAGYARVATTLGNLNLELFTDTAPRAVWNFVRLAQKGYYKGVAFHRNIPRFMIQGGDPTGTGRGGESIWGKTFKDEFEGPRTHNARGIVSMANKGKNTNSSQFFILYGPASHLDRKHTIFGQVVGGLDVLDKMERAKTGEGDRPVDDITIKDVTVFVDPFEEFQKKRKESEEKEKEEERRKIEGTEEDRVTWTGKRVRGDGVAEDAGGEGGEVGKYLRAKLEEKGGEEDEVLEVIEEVEDVGYEEPTKKKKKTGGGFGDFSAW